MSERRNVNRVNGTSKVKKKSNSNSKTESRKKRVNSTKKQTKTNIQRPVKVSSRKNIKKRTGTGPVKKVSKIKIRKSIDSKVNIISNNVSGFKTSRFVYFIVLYISVVVFFMLTFFSEVEKLNSENLRLQDEKQILLEEKRNLEINLNNSYNLANIKKIAENRLNMRKPEEHQIIYIDVPKEQSVSYQTRETDLEESFLDFIKNIF